MDTGHPKLENFIAAFRANSGGCVRHCACGRVFYDTVREGYDWEEGEYEGLLANPQATAVDGGPSDMRFMGSDYGIQCDCWHTEARKLMRFLDANAAAIAEYLSREKARKQHEADISPVVT